MIMQQTKYGYVSATEAKCCGELDAWLKQQKRGSLKTTMSKHNKHAKSHKKSKIKNRKRKALQARELNELKLKDKANQEQGDKHDR